VRLLIDALLQTPESHKTVSTGRVQHTEIPLPRDKEPLRFGSTLTKFSCGSVRSAAHGNIVSTLRGKAINIASRGSRPQSIPGFTLSTVSAVGHGRPVPFAVQRQPLCWNFLYHSRIVLSVDGGSVWYLVRNLHCIFTIDSVLKNSKTQNPVRAMIRHDCSLAVKPANTLWSILPKQSWRNSLRIQMLLSAVSLLIPGLPSSEVLKGLMNYPVYIYIYIYMCVCVCVCVYVGGHGTVVG
jgi:hypothetical protein